MTWKLFLDDERYPVDNSWMIARSSDAAIALCKEYGFPNYISFDHDLGGDDTSIKFIHWMINETLNSIASGGKVLPFPKTYFVHSQNPVGAENIRGLMNSFILELSGDF